jgi:hypothetical protein
MKVDDVEDRRRSAEQLERFVRDVPRRDDAEVDHGPRSVPVSPGAAVQEKLQEIAYSIRPPPYLPERMFPQLKERIGPALDFVVEFSTLGEYRLNADGVLCAASALTPVSRKRPARPGAQRLAQEREPQMGGAGAPNAARAAVRRIVAGGAAGSVPAATPAARRPPLDGTPAVRRPACDGRDSVPRRPACAGKPAVQEQLCLAV